MAISKEHKGKEKLGIVPLYSEEITSPLIPPHLVYFGGPLLTSVEVFTIFWGSAWGTSQKHLTEKINHFFGIILVSPIMDAMKEYSASNYIIGKGKFIGSVTIHAPSPKNPTSDSSIRTLILDQIKQKTLPNPTSNRLYFVYLPQQVTVEIGHESSCQAFCGYHNAISENLFYAVMPYPDCKGCVGKLSVFDALTSTSSHELCEAITDPVPGTGWYDNNNGEIGDICAWKTKKIESYTVQLEWSNKKKACL